MSTNRGSSDIRFEVPNDELAVLDGYCHATGTDRTNVLKQVIAEWSAKQLHVATLICRVAGVNPTEPEQHR